MTIKPRNCLSNIICIQLKNQMTQNERQKGREKERKRLETKSFCCFRSALVDILSFGLM